MCLLIESKLLSVLPGVNLGLGTAFPENQKSFALSLPESHSCHSRTKSFGVALFSVG